jgi:tetratricopeptide (TPR) repeat protein
VLELLDFPVLVGWFYYVVDLFSFRGNEVIKRRRRRRRITSLVVCMVLGVVAGGAAWKLRLFRAPRPNLVRMRHDAEAAQADKDYARALALWEQLASKGGGKDEEALYQRGLCLSHLDRKDEARVVMSELADKESVHAGAHVWLAEDLRSKKPADAKEAKAMARDLEKHLSAAVSKDPRLVDSMRRLAQLKLVSRDKDKRIEAIALYERLAEESVDDRLTLAMLYASERKQESVRIPARSCLNEFETKLDQDPDDLRTRGKAVQSALLLRDYPLAEQFLIEGLRRPGEAEDDRLRFAMGAVHSEWSEDLARKGSLNEAVAMLVEALREAPDHPPTLQRLSVLARRPEWRPTVRTALLASLLEGSRMQGQLHGLVAGLAARDGRRDEARLHWRLAADNSVNAIVPLNELALLAMTDVPPNLPAALALVERGLEIDKNSPYLRATRGRILSMQGRLTDALPDLQAALGSAPTDPVLHAALYDVYVRQSMPELAEKHFSQAAESMPGLWIARARLLMMQGDKAQATKLAQDAAQVFRDRLKSNPRDFDTYLLLADSMLLTREFAEAAKLLEPALQSARKEEARQAVGRVYAEWAASEATKPAEATADRLTRLEKAVEYDPESRMAIQDLATIARAAGPQSKRAQAAVDKLLASAPPSALAHLAAGTSAWISGNKPDARKLLERAYEIDSTNADISNNLSWVISQSEPEDLPRALALVESALRQSPEHPNYRGTRGHLLARLKRWAEARVDLEHALKYREDPENRRVLNEVYKELGVRGPAAAPSQDPAKASSKEPSKEAAKEPAPEKKPSP